MSFQRAITEIERARAELDRVRTSASGWHDVDRRRFDTGRLDPLAAIATQVVAALNRAEAEMDAAYRSMNG